ncbi:MAG: hypothetical protein B6D34_12785 [Candidatus Brocadia sp. UTAMX1]|jgi:hypothetical protein|nr:MAG: hypothetical protein B6D34_12785 [Candidatus Brocadia sp. UTAMX1]
MKADETFVWGWFPDKSSAIVFASILYTELFIRYEYAIPAEAGIQKNMESRIKPGITDRCKFMSLCIVLIIQ